MRVACLTFNPFQENTYIVYDDSGECIIFDPGCQTSAEETKLTQFIDTKGLTPVRLINTHCHIDHVFGNKFVAEKYDLALEIHRDELPVLESCPMVSRMYNVHLQPSPAPSVFLEEGDTLVFGKNTKLEILLTPGHSPASLSFFHRKSGQLIAGDVLFLGSIGRTDLPGGNFETLISSIKTKIFPLGDATIVYPGHGSSTTVGFERLNNPFLKEV